MTSLTRSLTNPFECDPEVRTGTSCNVSQKRVEISKAVMGNDSLSLSQPMCDEPLPRSAASANVMVKRKIARKIENAMIAKTNDSKMPMTSTPAISKTKKKATKKCTYTHKVPWTGLSDLEYWNYYLTVPPTPIKNKRGQTLYEIDKVMGKVKCACGKTNYLVKWRGYPDRDNSCIPVLPIDFRAEWV
jgi:hypothetical protein